jgi:hypothetical protein
MLPLLHVAYRPFIDPIPYTGTVGWLLLFLPLIVLIAVAYKTIKLRDLSQLPREVVKLTLQIVIFMGAAAVALWMMVWVL